MLTRVIVMVVDLLFRKHREFLAFDIDASLFLSRVLDVDCILRCFFAIYLSHLIRMDLLLLDQVYPMRQLIPVCVYESFFGGISSAKEKRPARKGGRRRSGRK